MVKILLPTDFSDSATNAAEYAFGLFGFKDVQYILLHAFVEPNNSADMLVSLNDILQKQTREDLDKAYRGLIKQYPDCENVLEKRLEFGSLSLVLRAITANESIDYVVMGTSGASGLKKTFFGSNTSSALRRTKCPVITVPLATKFKGLKNIAFATDYEGLSSPDTLQPLVDLAKNNHSKLLMVNVNKVKVLAGGEHEIKGVNLGSQFEGIEQAFFTVDYPEVIEGIRHFVKDHPVDMLTMMAKEHTIYEKLFVGSFTKEMAMVSEMPLLVLHG